MKSSGNTTVARLICDEGTAKRVANLLSESLEASEAAIAAFEATDAQWAVEVHFETPPDEPALRRLVGTVTDAALAFDTIEPKDWVAASLADLKPVIAGRFTVHGAHDRAALAANRIGIEIEAALAFGTGHHGTTRGCLLALDRIVKERARRRARILDIGTGTGVLAVELARAGARVIAVDHSPRMLEAARAKARDAGLLGIELRQGDARALPLADGEVDAALAHMVVQYLASPGEVLREMARAVRPGGAVVVVDFLSHEHEWMRQELGVTWLGFAPEEVAGWFSDAGLGGVRVERQAAAAGGRDLPATFIASGRRPR